MYSEFVLRLTLLPALFCFVLQALRGADKLHVLGSAEDGLLLAQPAGG